MWTRRSRPWLALAALVLPPAAPGAGDPARILYVKAKNTHLKDSASPTANTVSVLQPGQPVTYEGREGTTPWHRVLLPADKGGARGFIYQANLSSSPPSLEVISKDPKKPLSPEAFASSGAAIKSLGPGALEYGATLERPESAQQLADLEKLAARVTDAQVIDYAREGGLPEVVGPATARLAPKTPARRASPRPSPGRRNK